MGAPHGQNRMELRRNGKEPLPRRHQALRWLAAKNESECNFTEFSRKRTIILQNLRIHPTGRYHCDAVLESAVVDNQRLL